MSPTKECTPLETRPVKKKRNRIEPLQNVISMRINDAELKSLEKLTKASSKSITDIMREALALWSSKRSDLCLD